LIDSLGLERDREKNLTRFASPYQSNAAQSTDGLNRPWLNQNNPNRNSDQHSIAASSVLQFDGMPESTPGSPTGEPGSGAGGRKKKKGIKAFFSKLGGGSVRSVSSFGNSPQLSQTQRFETYDDLSAPLPPPPSLGFLSRDSRSSSSGSGGGGGGPNVQQDGTFSRSGSPSTSSVQSGSPSFYPPVPALSTGQSYSSSQQHPRSVSSPSGYALAQNSQQAGGVPRSSDSLPSPSSQRFPVARRSSRETVGSRKSGLAIELDVSSGEPVVQPSGGGGLGFGSLAQSPGEMPHLGKRVGSGDSPTGAGGGIALSGDDGRNGSSSRNGSPTKARQNSYLGGQSVHQLPISPAGPNFSPQQPNPLSPSLMSNVRQAQSHVRSPSYPPPQDASSTFIPSPTDLSASSPPPPSRPNVHHRVSSNVYKDLPPLPPPSPAPDSPTNRSSNPNPNPNPYFNNQPQYPQQQQQHGHDSPSLTYPNHSPSSRSQSQQISSISSRRNLANGSSQRPMTDYSNPNNAGSVQRSPSAQDVFQNQGSYYQQQQYPNPRQQHQQRSASAMSGTVESQSGGGKEKKKRGTLMGFFGGGRGKKEKSVHEARPTREEMGLGVERVSTREGELLGKLGNVLSAR
jgi:hypothetical protein